MPFYFFRLSYSDMFHCLLHIDAILHYRSFTIFKSLASLLLTALLCYRLNEEKIFHAILHLIIFFHAKEEPTEYPDDKSIDPETEKGRPSGWPCKTIFPSIETDASVTLWITSFIKFSIIFLSRLEISPSSNALSKS